MPYRDARERVPAPPSPPLVAFDDARHRARTLVAVPLALASAFALALAVAHLAPIVARARPPIASTGAPPTTTVRAVHGGLRRIPIIVPNMCISDACSCEWHWQYFCG